MCEVHFTNLGKEEITTTHCVFAEASVLLRVCIVIWHHGITVRVTRPLNHLKELLPFHESFTIHAFP